MKLITAMLKQDTKLLKQSVQEIFFLPQLKYKLDISEISLIMNFTFPSDPNMKLDKFFNYIIGDIGKFVSHYIEKSAKERLLGQKTFSYLMSILNAIMDDDKF